jgi:hypothetical protein
MVDYYNKIDKQLLLAFVKHIAVVVVVVVVEIVVVAVEVLAFVFDLLVQLF